MARTYEAIQEKLRPEMRDCRTVPEVISTAAELWPDRDFMTFTPTGETSTYSELAERGDRIAGGLRSLGAGPGDTVGLYMTNSPEYIATIIGVIQSGAIEVPIDWNYKQRELEHAVTSAELSTIIAEPRESFLANLEYVAPKAENLERIVLTEAADTLGLDGLAGIDVLIMGDVIADAKPLGEERPTQAWEDPCAIIYTSGTTGDPKPTLMAHRSLILGAKSGLSAPIPEDDVTYNAFPLFHLNNQMCSFLRAVISGDQYVLAEEFSASSFMDEVVRNGVTSTMGLGGVPQILDSTYTDDAVADNPLQVMVGTIDSELKPKFERKFGLTYVTGYCQTESPSLIVNYPDPKGNAAGKPTLTDIGHEHKLIDDDGSEVAVREEGELVRNDPAAMVGYYNLPEKTAETLDDGWIYTGDILREDEDGYLYFVDRKKFMIRRGGENISPLQIDEVVGEFDEVEDVATIPVPDDYRGEEVKVMVKRKSDSLSPVDIVKYVGRNLAHYKTPRYVEFVDSFPRTPSQRIKRMQLKDEEKERADHGWDREQEFPDWKAHAQ